MKRDVGMSPAGANVRQYAYWRRLLLPGLLFAVTIGAFVLYIERGHQDARFQVAMAEQQSMAEQLAFNAVQLPWDGRGHVAASLEHLDDLKAAVDARLRFPDSAADRLFPPSPHLAVALAKLRSAWVGLRDAAGAVLAAERDIAVLRGLVLRFRSVATGILVTTDELLDALAIADEDARQTYAAARQLMLIQRMSASIRRLLEGGQGVLSAADRLGRDAVLFGGVTNGLLHGSRALRIPVVEDPESRDILQNLAREFRESTGLIENIILRADQVNARSRTIEQVRQSHARVRAASTAVLTAYRGGQRSLLLEPRIIAALAAMAMLALFAALVYLFRQGHVGHRAAIRQAENYARL